MELGELKVFLTVASERSFSRAAAKLYRSQPAISQAVRRLEHQLGEPLFDRTMKHGTLTPAGEVAPSPSSIAPTKRVRRARRHSSRP